MIEIKFTGTEELARALARVAKNFPRERNLFLQQEAKLLKGRAKLKTPVDTGRLRNSWDSTEPEGDSITVFNNTEYAIFVELPHRIVAWGHDTGRIQPGNFMLRDAIDESAAQFQADAVKILARLFK